MERSYNFYTMVMILWVSIGAFWFRDYGKVCLRSSAWMSLYLYMS